MPSKYDTNPLDPEFPEKARAAANAQTTEDLPRTGVETRQFSGAAPTEAQTRRFDQRGYAPYSPPFNGQYAPSAYQPASFAEVGSSSSRKIEKFGVSENILTAVPYIPWYIGMVFGLLILFLVPKSEAKARFHAAQGLAAHVAILIVTTILGIIGNIMGVAEAGNIVFQIVTSIMLIVFTVKAWKGKPVHIQSVDSLTNWLEEKIKPSKS
ncbi:MAG: hypothetical protein ABR530_01880 [Pyrinomonadaceae bacterium]